MAYELIINSDFDALACAHILEKHFEIDSVRFVEPGQVNAGDVTISKPETIVANLPYIDGAEVWFDHHKSNIDSHSEVKGLREIEPSCARVIANYFQEPDSELLRQADIIDAAEFTREDLKNPQGYQLYSLTIVGAVANKSDMDYNRRLISKLDDLDALLADEEVQERIAKIQNRFEEVYAFIKENATLYNNLLVVDMREAPSQEYLSSSYKFLHYTLNEQPNISMRIYHPDMDKSRIRFQVGHNIFNQTSKTDVSALLKPFGGGGHHAAGGLTLPAEKFEETFEKLKAIVIEKQ